MHFYLLSTVPFLHFGQEMFEVDELVYEVRSNKSNVRISHTQINKKTKQKKSSS